MMRASDRFHRLTHSEALSVELKASTVRGGAYATAAEGIGFLLRLGSVVILARLLVPEYFGLIGMVTAITAVAEHFKDLGLGSATIQSPEITHEQASTLFWVNAGMGILVMLVVAALAYPVALFYQDPRLTFITLAISTSFFWRGAANQHDALLRRTMRFDRIAAVQLTASLLSIIVAVLLALKGFGYWALVGREVSGNMFLAVGAWVCFPWLPGAPSRQVGVGRMLRFGAGITGFNLTYLVSTSLDQVLIGKIFGAHPLGIYRQGMQLVLTPMEQLGYPVRVVAESALSRLQDDADRYRRYFRKILSALSLATFPLGLFVAVYASDVVLVMLGAQWIEATPIVRILAASALMQPAVNISGAVMVTCGQSRKFFWLGLVSSATLVAFFFIGIPFGIAGIASAHVWALWLLLVPRLYWSFKDTPISIGTFFSAIRRPAVNSAVMVAALLILRRIAVVDGQAAHLGLGLVVALIAYFGAWLALPRGRAELKTMVMDLSGPAGLSQLLLRRRLRPATRVHEQGS